MSDCNSKVVSVAFVVDKVTTEQVIFKDMKFYPAN
jgi:hypothetical protein